MPFTTSADNVPGIPHLFSALAIDDCIILVEGPLLKLPHDLLDCCELQEFLLIDSLSDASLGIMSETLLFSSVSELSPEELSSASLTVANHREI